MGEVFNSPITETTTTIWEDNQSAIAYSQNALVSEKTKLRLGIDDILRTISTYFAVFSETPNAKVPEIAAKCACKISTIPSIPSLRLSTSV
jgi:hypothetical protein